MLHTDFCVDWFDASFDEVQHATRWGVWLLQVASWDLANAERLKLSTCVRKKTHPGSVSAADSCFHESSRNPHLSQHIPAPSCLPYTCRCAFTGNLKPALSLSLPSRVGISLDGEDRNRSSRA